jgi:hypothetical protein
MRRSRRNDSDQYGGLAGWLFADIALVLALAFLSSKVIGRNSVDAQPGITTTTTTTTTTQPPASATSQQKSTEASGASVREIALSEVCISDPDSLFAAYPKVEAKLREENESPTAKFSVLLIYAGYAGASSDQDPLVLQDEAKERARVLRDTLQGWSRLSKENWVKDLGHDRGTTIGCYKLYLLKAIEND